MANLQAIGVDGVTAIYLLAEGTGTNLDPFISKFNINNWPSSFAVTGTFWQATQPVSLASLPSLASGSNVIGAISNTSFQISNFPSSQVVTFGALPAGSNAIGSITNSTFASTQSGTWTVGLTGTLPAFAATPTVNIGTIGGCNL
jgi:hypothetical protein